MTHARSTNRRPAPARRCRSVVLFTVALLGCEIEGPGTAPADAEEDPCAGEPVHVAGLWRLDGGGRRFDCEEGTAAPNGGFDLRLDPPLRVAQDGGALRLEPGQPVSVDGFSLSGNVRGSCVEVTIVEAFEGDTVRTDFSGSAREGEIHGSFTGRGPGSCGASGDFTIAITR